MEGFSPEFFLQIIVSVGSVGAMYGAIRTDLSNMKRDISDEKRLREVHETADDVTHHDLRNEVQKVGLQLASITNRSYHSDD